MGDAPDARQTKAGMMDGLGAGRRSEFEATDVPMTLLSDRAEPERSEILPVLEETFAISKRQVVTGRVRVGTRTETVEQVAEVALDRGRVEVTRVPIGRTVDAAPPVRTEGETTIVPVMEERLVVVKQLVLVEELHIRHRVEQETVRTAVPLRRQTVTIEHLDGAGRVVGSVDGQPPVGGEPLPLNITMGVEHGPS